MAKRVAQNISLGSFDDLFGETTAPVEVSLLELREFKNHPFKVLDDDSMLELVESIKERGVLSPGIARVLPDGSYELISGHRRKRACAIAGLLTMPVFVREMTDDEAIIAMVDENLQRPAILPSEKAKSYRMKYDALKHQGKEGGNSLDKMEESESDSRKTIQRFICLSNLSEELLEFVDLKRLGIVQGVNISYLSEEYQGWIYDYISENEIAMSLEQSNKIKEFGKSGELTQAMIRLILSEEKPKERKVTLKGERISKYFSEEYSNDDIEKVICELLDDWISKKQ